MEYIELNQNKLLNKVHKLVIDIVFNNLRLDPIMDELNDLYHPFMYYYEGDDELVYSMPIEAFFRSTQCIVGDQYPEDVIWDHKSVSKLIDILLCYKRDIECEQRYLVNKERKNRRVLEQYIAHLTDHYSRLLFVRVDLKYAQDYSDLISIDDFNEHINKICQLIGNKKTCFKDLQGHAWALEQGGIEGGLHCHLLLMYDGAKRQNDWHIAKEVGEKWVQITEGYGVYYNYHESENKRGSFPNFV